MSRELRIKGPFGRWSGSLGLLGLVLLLVVSTPIQGQSTHGSIVGTVTDATNAVLPGVSVTVINKDTNFSRVVLTNDAGYYEATALLAGTYRVQAEFPGFKTLLREGIVLESRAIVRMDLRMEIGEQSTSIEVTGTSPVIQSETASLSDLKTADHLEQLPNLSTQNLWNVVVTMPGVQTVQGRTIFSFNGARGAQSEIMFDGMSTPRLTPLWPAFRTALKPPTKCRSTRRTTMRSSPRPG